MQLTEEQALANWITSLRLYVIRQAGVWPAIVPWPSRFEGFLVGVTEVGSSGSSVMIRFIRGRRSIDTIADETTFLNHDKFVEYTRVRMELLARVELRSGGAH